MTKENLLELTQNDKGSWIQKGQLVQKMIPKMYVDYITNNFLHIQPA